jgi:hypothetical protein
MASLGHKQEPWILLGSSGKMAVLFPTHTSMKISTFLAGIDRPACGAALDMISYVLIYRLLTYPMIALAPLLLY